MGEKNIIKPTSMRLGEEDLKQFKQYADELGLNQAEAFNSLIALAELEKAKNSLNDRAKSIDVFRSTINSLVGFYINSLEENSRAEDIIRQEFSKQLETKDNTIQDLQEKNRAVTGELAELKKYQDQQNQVINNYSKEVESLNESIEDKNKQLNTLEQNNAMLQEQLIEYKQYKSLEQQYKLLQEQLNKADTEYKEQIQKIKEENISYVNNISLLNDKLKSNIDIINFYKEQTTELKLEIKEINKSITDKENSYKLEIKALEEKNIKELKKNKEEVEEQLNNRHEVELEKKNIEIDKLKNMLNNLQDKLKENSNIRK